MAAGRKRFKVIPGKHNPNHVRAGGIFLAVLGILIYSGYSRHLLFVPRGGTEIKAEFLDATNVQGDTLVRIQGVNVGKVSGVETVGEGIDRRAVVTMRVDDEDADLLRANARANIWWRTLLGRNVYIELSPGSASAALGGATIPASRTDTQIEFDQALEPLNDRGRGGFRTFLKTTDSALADTRAPREDLKRLGPAMKPVAPGLAGLSGEHPGDLTQAVRGTRDVAATLDRSEAALGNLIDSANVTLSVTAARRADLSAVLQQAPGALSATRTEMGRIRETLDRLDPVARDLRPGARALDDAADSLTPALRATQPMLDDLRPLLVNLNPAVTRLRTVADHGVPLIRSLEPTVRRMNTELLPWLNSVDDSGRKVFQLIGPTFSALDSLTQAFDSFGHNVAFQPGFGTRFFDGTAPCSTPLNDPSATQKINCEKLFDTLEPLLGNPGQAPAVRSAPVAAARPPAPAAAAPRRITTPEHRQAESPLAGYWTSLDAVLAGGVTR